MSKLWLVEIHEDDFEYDCFVSAVVWGESAEDAERTVRSDVKSGLPQGDKTRFTVAPAPATGVVHEHWHAG